MTHHHTMAARQTLCLTNDWDKIFPKNDSVAHEKITFYNRYGITLAADLYRPRENACPGKGDVKTGETQKKLPAIALCGPFGAVKEQVSGLYAQTLAQRGFLTIAFDPSFTGESGGTPRYVASADINTEDFCAAVDFLCTHPLVNADQIAVIGICGWGGFALNAAAIDPRIQVAVTSTMYDMTRVTAKGYFDSEDSADARHEKRLLLAKQRTADYAAGTYSLGGGVPDTLPDDAPAFFVDYHSYYKTKRGYHPRSLGSNNGWALTSSISLLNMPILQYSHEIRAAVLMIHGEDAHSCYFSKDAYDKLTTARKELLLIPGAVHCDLYDNMEKIPFDRIESFIRQYI